MFVRLFVFICDLDDERAGGNLQLTYSQTIVCLTSEPVEYVAEVLEDVKKIG